LTYGIIDAYLIWLLVEPSNFVMHYFQCSKYRTIHIRIVRYETIQVRSDTNRELYRVYSCIVLVSYDTSPNRANHDSIHDTNLP